MAIDKTYLSLVKSVLDQRDPAFYFEYDAICVSILSGLVGVREGSC